MLTLKSELLLNGQCIIIFKYNIQSEILVQLFSLDFLSIFLYIVVEIIQTSSNEFTIGTNGPNKETVGVGEGVRLAFSD